MELKQCVYANWSVSFEIFHIEMQRVEEEENENTPPGIELMKNNCLHNSVFIKIDDTFFGNLLLSAQICTPIRVHCAQRIMCTSIQL